MLKLIKCEFWKLKRKHFVSFVVFAALLFPIPFLIKLRQKGVKVPFLLMSGDDDTRLRNEAQACGAVFCCKTDYDLIARINEMVG